jgi:hypothetical protein
MLALLTVKEEPPQSAIVLIKVEHSMIDPPCNDDVLRRVAIMVLCASIANFREGE